MWVYAYLSNENIENDFIKKNLSRKLVLLTFGIYLNAKLQPIFKKCLERILYLKNIHASFNNL